MPKTSPPPGEIAADRAYTLDEIGARLGLGRYALARAQAAGMPTRKVGRRKYALGSDVLDWLQTQPVGNTR